MSDFRVPERDQKLYSLDRVLARIARLTSTRKVRQVVTPSGQRARGNAPSIKAPGQARFESIAERDVLRVFDVASCVHLFATHPVVLALVDGDKTVHYTPDVRIQSVRCAALVEVKAAYFLTQAVPRSTLQRNVRLLRAQQLPLVVVLDTDVRAGGLQTELEELLRLRPVVSRLRRKVDRHAWDPLGRSVATPELARRWAAAQKECDDLLARVMRRDPDDLIASIAS